MRSLARVLPLALVPALLTGAGPTPSAVGGIGVTDVSITSAPAFSPETVKIGLDTSVTWTNNDGTTHTATSNNGFFNTGNISAGQEDTVEFESAGTYRYHCNLHAHMTGSVKVRMARSGSPEGGWMIQWASPSSSGFTYDVQVDKPGDEGFVTFRDDTSRRTATFNPSRTGTYRFRARTNDGGQSTGYSPVLSVGIT